MNEGFQVVKEKGTEERRAKSKSERLEKLCKGV
jgi:hypothetical protein